MKNEYLRAFVIGSSFLVFIPYFIVVSQFDPKKFNFSYVYYTLFAPFFLGLANVISLVISNIFNLTKKMRFLLISLLAPTIVMFTVIFFKIYNYTVSEWISHIFKLYLLYFIMFNYVLYLLDKYV